MRRRVLVAAVAVLAVLSAFSLSDPAFARSGPGARATTTPATTAATNPSSASAAASGGPRSLSRTDRGILLVTLTFLVGVGLLGAPDTQESTERRRPAITLYDDPALVERSIPRRRRLGEPPPLR